MKRRWISIIIGLMLVAMVTVFGNICKINSVEVSFDKEPVTVDAVEIFDNSKIELGSSILSLNENVVKRNVGASYDDNSITVTNIERIFPNKVIIYCTEHIAMCAVLKKGNENVYALADGDFQLNKVVNKSEADLSELILLEGVEVDVTYNTHQFSRINKIFKVFAENGISYARQTELFEKLVYSDTDITIFTRDGGVFTINYTDETLKEAVLNEFNEFFNQNN